MKFSLKLMLTALICCCTLISYSQSREKDILTFIILNGTGPADIDNLVHNVEVEVEYGTDLTSLPAEWTLSDGATSDPVSGSTNDYSSIFTIIVTAEDGSTQDWEVDVTVAEVEESKKKDILSFIIENATGEADIDNLAHNVEIEVANGTDLTSLTAQWTLSDGATSDPVSGSTSDYSSVFTIAVTAEDGSTQDWEVDVTEVEVEESSEKDIRSFIIENATGEADIDNLAHNVEIEVANGTDLTSLTAQWTLSDGATSDPVSGSTSDYSSIFTIVVTAEDGSTQDWEVDVTVAEVEESNEKDIRSFFIENETGPADIDNLAHNVEVEVTNGTDLTSLMAQWTLSDGATSDPVSGSTSDYSNIFTITVTAEDGSTQDWEVDVTEAEVGGSNEKDIRSFFIESETGPADIDNLVHNVEIEVENGTDLTNLTAHWTLSDGATSDPVSGSTSDYSSIFTITVTAEDASTQDWEVDVTVAEVEESNEKDIISFIILNATGPADIDNIAHNVEVEVEYGTDLTSLPAQWTLSDGATSDPVSGSTSDYSSIFTITVTAEDGSTQDWEVDVTEAELEGSNEKDILSFIILNGTGPADIDNIAHNVEVEVEYGTDLTSLPAHWRLSDGATSDPVSGSTSDYSSIFTITVTAEDGSTQDWEVDVTVAEAGESDEKDIRSFIIENGTGPGDIDNVAHNVEIEVTKGTDLTSLTAFWALSNEATSDPVSGSTSDYSSIFTITVTAEDGSTQDWEIDVTEAEATGVDDASALDLKIHVYPNPAINILYIDSEEKISRAIVHSIKGEMIIDISRPELSAINLSELKSGVYVLSLYNDNEYLVSKRLVKD